MSESDLILVVDDQDRPIGNEPIRTVRENGLIHRLARVMLEDGRGRILLQKRADKVFWPNCWDNSAAGHVDAGEEYLQAAKRELYEEIGIRSDSLKEVGTYFTDTVYRGKPLRRFNKVYKLVTNVTPTRLQKSEVTEVRWFSLDEAKKLVTENPELVTDGLRDTLERYYS